MRRRQERRQRRRSGLRGTTNVNLISMMDILTVLLLFLLKSYVADGEVMVPPKGVNLPASTAKDTPQSSLVVAIDGDAIHVGDDVVVSIADAVNAEGMEIAPLSARLAIERQKQNAFAASQGATKPPPRSATIQGDRQIEFRLLQKVMYTLNLGGYESIALAVLQNS